MYTRFLFLLISLQFIVPPAQAAFKNRTFEEVLLENFSKCELKKENVFLSKNQIAQIENELSFKVSALMLRFYNPCNKSYIYVDSHPVRTLNETVLIELKKGEQQQDELSWLEIASFMEPKEYVPPKKWLELFKKRSVNKVDGLTGATLSENAIKKVVEKYKVVNRVLGDKK